MPLCLADSKRYWRFGCFFILGALCVGIVLPYNDPTLIRILDTQGTSNGGASPYIIAMQNLGITGLPHLVNALLVTSIFSAGNTYCYMATRSLYSLSLQGHAPKFLRATTAKGIPHWCFAVTMIFPFLSFLQVSGGTAQAIKWLVNIVTASQVLNYVIMGTTYLCFYRALKVQGVDRRTLPYRGNFNSPHVNVRTKKGWLTNRAGWFQPYVNIFGLIFVIVIVVIQGYAVFLPGFWDVGTFFTYYTMIFVCMLLFVGWKVVKKTKFVHPRDADLVWEKPVIDAYEASREPPLGLWEDVWATARSTLRIGRQKRQGSGV